MYKYTCKTCGKGANTQKEARKLFKRCKLNGKELLNNICKCCEEKELENSEWKDGKLKCRICGEYNDPSNFSKSKSYASSRDNHDYRCNDCKKKQNQERRNNYSDDRKIEALLISRFHGAKDRAKNKDIPFDLTLEFLKELLIRQNYKCAISDLELTFNLDNGRNPFNVSLDQIDPNKGYVKENIQLVCMSVNQLKSDFDMDTVIKICSAVVRNNKENLVH